MKVILSRKGFDSAAGGFPSPILPDGRLVSLPIPDVDSKTSYDDLCFEPGTSYYDLMVSLTPVYRAEGVVRSLQRSTKCHLDPDLLSSVRERRDGFRGAFGQIGTAQRHLENQNVEPGDLFLFFGWFRGTSRLGFQYSYLGEDRHEIYGYLQIGEVLAVDLHTSIPAWLEGHPHLTEHRRRDRTNRIYVARDHLSWDRACAGYGVFRSHPSLILTKEGHARSRWHLPGFFQEVRISYHNIKSFRGGHFQSATRGQEFVIQGSEEVIKWAKGLIEKNNTENGVRE
ncbi:MAG: hypothetical protein AMS17_16555 [Spirochaetes bacterium DG_61]|nr:MAG: hypothetical protein AMS17_16555 [Spirochaetes bacterium DG_61]